MFEEDEPYRNIGVQHHTLIINDNGVQSPLYPSPDQNTSYSVVASNTFLSLRTDRNVNCYRLYSLPPLSLFLSKQKFKTLVSSVDLHDNNTVRSMAGCSTALRRRSFNALIFDQLQFIFKYSGYHRTHQSTYLATIRNVSVASDFVSHAAGPFYDEYCRSHVSSDRRLVVTG